MLVVLEEPALFPSTCRMAHNSNPRGADALLAVASTVHMGYVDIHTAKIFIKFFKFNFEIGIIGVCFYNKLPATLFFFFF